VTPKFKPESIFEIRFLTRLRLEAFKGRIAFVTSRTSAYRSMRLGRALSSLVAGIGKFTRILTLPFVAGFVV